LPGNQQNVLQLNGEDEGDGREKNRERKVREERKREGKI
jgi:hypothetical protein